MATKLTDSYKIIVLDGGSTDKTGETTYHHPAP